MTTTDTSETAEQALERKREAARKANRLTYWLAEHWLLMVNTLVGIFVLLPFVAPVLMHLGLEGPGRAIHVMYMAFCHQFPQRSYFLFGPQTMYSLDEIALVWHNVENPLILRQFIGTPEMGWKVAWSDRMVSMYGGMLLFGLLYGVVRRWRTIKPLPLWGIVLFSIPMGIDGVSHVVSDLFGIGQGFRYTNEWLAELTNFAFSVDFYVGNGLGSFNWWMRLITGLLFALGVVWLAYPHLENAFGQTRRQIEAKFRRAGLELGE